MEYPVMRICLDESAQHSGDKFGHRDIAVLTHAQLS